MNKSAFKYANKLFRLKFALLRHFLISRFQRGLHLLSHKDSIYGTQYPFSPLEIELTRLIKAIDSLPKDLQQPFILFLCGQNLSQIAYTLNISTDNALQKIVQAHHLFFKILANK